LVEIYFVLLINFKIQNSRKPKKHIFFALVLKSAKETETIAVEDHQRDMWVAGAF